MFSFNSSIARIYPSINNVVRSFCVKKSNIVGVSDFAFQDIFSPEEHSKILDTLNESTPEDLSRYKISNGKINVMLNWKKKKGPFRSLAEVLEVEGFGEKMLKEICKNIANNNVSEVKYKPARSNKHVKQLLIPDMMDLSSSTTLESAVSIHLAPTGIGWAKLEKKSNKLTDWKYDNFGSLPTKMLPPDTFNLAMDILKTTPVADAYIFEAPANLSPQSQTKHGLVSAHNQQIELTSMLLSLLNTSRIHNPRLQKLSTEEYYSRIENRVFYLKHKIPARLFNTLIGHEKVSVISVVVEVMNKDSERLRTLPYTPVAFETNLKQCFLSGSSTNKELLGQALILAMSFMDLCIRRNPESYEALRPKRNNKQKEQR